MELTRHGQTETEVNIPMVDEKSRDPTGQDSDKKRDEWASQIEYFLSVIGFSVALGNVWRFPYICNRNGGGAFLIPFVICLALCGLPLFFLEVAIGQFSGKSPVHVWSLCPLMKGIGLGMVIIAGGVPIYYTVICAWSLYYTVFSCTAVLPWTSCNNTWNTDNCVTSVKVLKQNHSNGLNVTIASDLSVPSYQINVSSGHLSYTAAEEFWQYNALRITNGLEDVGSIKWELALCLLGSWIIIFLCVVKGVKSLGKMAGMQIGTRPLIDDASFLIIFRLNKAVYITATVPYIILTVLLVRGLTLPGGPSGALYYITPDFSKLLHIQVWIEACLQMFYSLGPAWGGLITMASYNNFHVNCYRNAVICTFVSEGTSMFAGLVVFSILGYMAQEAGVPITDVVSSGPGLGFVTYPEVLAQLSVPQLWSFIFFAMLILLAIDFLFAAVETALSAIFDEFPFLLKWRAPVVILYCLVSFLLGLVLTTEGGMYIFQLIDWYILAIFPLLAGFLECIVLGWVYGIQRFSADIEMMIGRQAPVFFKITWCYITPAILLMTFIVTLCQYKPPTYGKYVYPGYASSIGWSIAVVPVLPMIFMAVHVIYKQQGSFLQRLRQTLLPDHSWSPSKQAYRDLYQEKWDDGVSIRDTCVASVTCTS